MSLNEVNLSITEQIKNYKKTLDEGKEKTESFYSINSNEEYLSIIKKIENGNYDKIYLDVQMYLTKDIGRIKKIIFKTYSIN